MVSAVGGTVLIVTALSLCVAGGVYHAHRSKRSSTNKSLQSSGRSPQKYSESPDKVHLLRVSETEQSAPPSCRPPGQRVSVSLSSLAQYRSSSEPDASCEQHKLDSLRPPLPQKTSPVDPRPSVPGRSTVTLPHLHPSSSSPLTHNDTHTAHSRYSHDTLNRKGPRTSDSHTPSHRHLSPPSLPVSPAPGPRTSHASQRSASSYGMGAVYNTQVIPRRLSLSPSYQRSSNSTSQTSGSSWTTATANGSVVFAYGRPVHGSLSSLPDQVDTTD